jgi:hypothetical protein
VRDLGLLFTERPDSLAGARAELLALLRAARARVDSSVPQTSMERELLESSRLPTFVTTVERAESITPQPTPDRVATASGCSVPIPSYS